ncbi:MAG: RnfABCDGE type electron transport complex subunit D [Paracoccaceae bacterium]
MRFLEVSGQRSGPPFVSFGFAPAQITLLQVVALLAPVLASLITRGMAAVQVGILVLIVSLVWEALFAFVRRRPLTWHGLTTALILVVMAPDTVPLWELALAVSFGVTLGELVFGGRGFGFLNGAVAALAFLIFSFPGTGLAGNSALIAICSLPGALLLMVAGLISWRVLVSAIGVLTVFSLAKSGEFDPATTLAAVAFALVFLVCDPLSAASTNPGRWVYGGLVGGLAVYFDPLAGPAFAPSALVFAALLGGIFAPLIDHGVVMALVAWRRRRFG